MKEFSARVLAEIVIQKMINININILFAYFRFVSAIKRILAGIFAMLIFVHYDPQYPLDFLATVEFKVNNFTDWSEGS